MSLGIAIGIGIGPFGAELAGGSAPSTASHITAENNSIITTEAGDQLITET